MSKIFYDHLIILSEVEVLIKTSASSIDEKEELWKIVDEILHHRVMEVILDNLPREYHEEFLGKFVDRPYDDELIVYINEKAKKDIEKEIRKEAKSIESEILKEIKKSK